MIAATLDRVIIVVDYVRVFLIEVENHARGKPAQYFQNYAFHVILRNAFPVYLDSICKVAHEFVAAAMTLILVVQYVIMKKVAIFMISVIVRS